MVENAEAITMSGQLVNKWTSGYIDNFLREILGVEHSLWVYSDTDSVVGDTEIMVNGERTTIAEYYDSVNNDFIKRDDFNEDWVKRVEGDKTYSVSSDGKLSENNIRYVMKHKVKKKMYRISVGGKEITVTEDHSVMVKRKGSIVSVKPTDITEGDLLITIE